jgi:hypothetical protein
MHLDVAISFMSSVQRFIGSSRVSKSVSCFILSHLWTILVHFSHTVDNFKISLGSSFTSPFHSTFMFKVFDFDICKRVNLQQHTIYLKDVDLLVYECRNWKLWIRKSYATIRWSYLSKEFWNARTVVTNSTKFGKKFKRDTKLPFKYWTKHVDGNWFITSASIFFVFSIFQTDPPFCRSGAIKIMQISDPPWRAQLCARSSLARKNVQIEHSSWANFFACFKIHAMLGIFSSMGN